MIRREKYIEQMKNFIPSTSLIKALVGMRRTGKSIILEQIANDLRSEGVPDSRIIEINLEKMEFIKLNTIEKLNDYVLERVVGEDIHYLFIDEVQNIPNFEKVIASLNTDKRISIFITGSNANLLAGELATKLSGRYVRFDIFPFTYNEFLDLKNEKHTDETLDEYLTYGGMPEVINAKTPEDKLRVLRDTLKSIVERDILSRASIRKSPLLNSLIDYLVNNSSMILSVKSITNYLEQTTPTKRATVDKYIEHILNSLFIYRCDKYYIKGKEVLNKLNKVYLNDLGFKTIDSISTNPNYSLQIETAVFNHLKSQGYKIKYGVDRQDREIDFIIEKNSPDGLIKKYVQASYKISQNEDTANREFLSLEKLKNNYEKYVITADKEKLSKDGIKHLYIGDFLQIDDF